MTTEDRLRAAITARTSGVEPSTNALHRIEEKLMETRPDRNRNRLLLGIAAAVAVVAGVVGALALDDEGTVDTVASSTTEAPSTTGSTTTTDSTTTTAGVPGTVDPATPVFPDPTTSRRFDDPVALTHAFAVDLLGFRDPIVGDLAQGDARSGEVEVRSFAAGQPTTVIVRQLEDDTWFVLGASVESIRLNTPAAGATISSPQPLAGAASAFEGHVNVRLYVDGAPEPSGETFVTGRGDGVLGDFTGELTFTVPVGARHGVLVLSEASAQDGSTVAATVIRVHF